jgi:hypothetical protein
MFTWARIYIDLNFDSLIGKQATFCWSPPLALGRCIPMPPAPYAAEDAGDACTLHTCAAVPLLAAASAVVAWTTGLWDKCRGSEERIRFLWGSGLWSPRVGLAYGWMKVNVERTVR